MTNAPELLAVEQIDRDAAADVVRYGAPGLGNGNTIIAAEIKGKLHDNYAVVQAFARHRLEAHASTAAEDAAQVLMAAARREP